MHLATALKGGRTVRGQKSVLQKLRKYWNQEFKPDAERFYQFADNFHMCADKVLYKGDIHIVLT